MTESQNSSHSVRGHIVFAFALALALYLAWLIRGVLVLLYVSALFAVVLTPVVRATSRIRIGRWHPFHGAAAIFFLLLIVAGALTAFGFLALPPVIRDLQALNGEMPTRLPALLARFRQFPFADRLNSAEVIASIQGSLSHAAARSAALAHQLGRRARSGRRRFRAYALFHSRRRRRLSLVSLVSSAAAPPPSRRHTATRRRAHGKVAYRPGQPHAHPGNWPAPSSISRSMSATPTPWACSPACSM